jgi:adenylate cyclase
MASRYFPRFLRRWRWLQYLGGLGILALVLVETLGDGPLSLIDRLEWEAYDLRVRHTLSGVEDPSLVMIDIDEKSLQEIGQWPWPRAVLADLVEALFDEQQAALLGVDVVFDEPEALVWEDHWQALREDFPELEDAAPPVEGDRQLAEVLAEYPVVLGYYFQATRGASDPPPVGRLSPPVTFDAPEGLPLPRPERYTANLAGLQAAALGGGFFDNPRVDDDGVFRRVPMLQRWEGETHAALPLAMLLAMLGQPPVVAEVAEVAGRSQLEGLEVGGFEIPVDERGAALVPWYGPRDHFDRVSAVDVLEGRVDEGRLEGASLILGSTAPGLMDLRSTPVGGVFPGPEINLSLLAGMLHQSFLAEPPWVAGVEFVGLLVLGLLMVAIYPYLNAPVMVAVSLALGGLVVGGNLWAWHQGLVLPVAGLLVLLVTQMLWHLTMNLFRESRQKRWVVDRFGQYVPPKLVDDMVDRDESFGLEGEERELTVLFSDVRNFTAFSESLTPTELTSVMNRLLTPLTQAIHRHQGTIDKYMGDAVMAFWGAPLKDVQHARRALEGASAMLEALAALNRDFAAEGKSPLAMGIGLNTGPMSVGNMGSSFRVAYTVMGDNVNLASRLEGLTRNYGVPLIVSETTAEQVPDWAFRRLDRVRVKGREAPLWILEPLGPADGLSDERAEWRDAFEAALASYQAGEFEAAQAAFRPLAEADPVARLYLERLARLRASPPERWDGIWRHRDK